MQRKPLPMMLAAVMAVAGMQVQRRKPPAAQLTHPLAVRISKPLQWKNGCLQVSIDRLNRSSNPIFLPSRGLYAASSTTKAVTPSEQRPAVKWSTVYGAADLVDWDAAPLAAGETRHDDMCVGPTFAVTNLKKKTRRHVPVRGRLKIYAYYFLSEQDWLANKSQHEEMFRTAPSKWPKPLNILEPEEVTVTVPIPCRESPCNPACEGPPIVLNDEVQIIPDVTDMPEWNERGQAINKELAQKLSPCSAP
jgi:hypothetical protein